MTTERITVKASDLQIGDWVYRGPFRGSWGLENERIIRLSPQIEANGNAFSPDTEFTVDRPIPTVTVELPADVVERFLNHPYPSTLGYRTKAIYGALKQAMQGSEDSTEPELRVGAKVRRTGSNSTASTSWVTPGDTDGGTGRYYEPGTIGTVMRIDPIGRPEVNIPEDHLRVRTWRVGSFEVIG